MEIRWWWRFLVATAGDPVLTRCAPCTAGGCWLPLLVAQWLLVATAGCPVLTRCVPSSTAGCHWLPLLVALWLLVATAGGPLLTRSIPSAAGGCWLPLLVDLWLLIDTAAAGGHVWYPRSNSSSHLQLSTASCSLPAVTACDYNGRWRLKRCGGCGLLSLYDHPL